MGKGMKSVRVYINDFVKKNLDDYLHKNQDVADIIQNKIIDAEKERKELSGIRKLAKERAKKANIHNKKLRDCRIHLNDLKKPKQKNRLYKCNSRNICWISRINAHSSLNEV